MDTAVLRSTATADLVSAIGSTPLVRVRAFDPEIAPVELYAKAEHLNPGRSVKDRPALEMILEGERSGGLTREKAILDATSGNTGIALTWIGTARGYRVTLCIPANASPERIAVLQALGAELVLTDPQESHDGAYREAGRLAREKPARYWYANQYDNPANWRAHHRTTGPEVWEQTEGRVTSFVAGIGTSGTLTGVGRFLRERNAEVALVAVQPDSPLHGMEGFKHLATAFHPGIWDPELPDRTIEVSTEAAQAAVMRLAREEGILAGTSTGANLHAAVEVARDLDEGVVVTVLCDDGRMYLDETYWREMGR